MVGGGKIRGGETEAVEAGNGETGEENGGCGNCGWIGKLRLWEDGETEAVELIPEELETLEFGVFVKNASSAPAGH